MLFIILDQPDLSFGRDGYLKQLKTKQKTKQNREVTKKYNLYFKLNRPFYFLYILIYII